MEYYTRSYNYYDQLYDRAGKPHFAGHLPGYGGYSPGKRYTEGLTFGAATEKINKKIRSEIESRFSEPRGPKCTPVARYSTCHGLPMAMYRERPQSGTVFTNKEDMDKLISSLAWYSRSAKERALLGENKLLPHRYKHRTYSSATNSTSTKGSEEPVIVPENVPSATQRRPTAPRPPRKSRDHHVATTKASNCATQSEYSFILNNSHTSSHPRSGIRRVRSCRYVRPKVVEAYCN